MSLKFAWRLDAYKTATSPTSTSSAEIAHVNIVDKTGATPLLAIFFLTGEGHAGMTFAGTDSPPPFQALALPTMTTWYEVELKVTLMVAGAARFDVIIDGVTTGTLQNKSVLTAPQADFDLGASITGPFDTTGWSIDNATFGPLL